MMSSSLCTHVHKSANWITGIGSKQTTDLPGVPPVTSFCQACGPVVRPTGDLNGRQQMDYRQGHNLLNTIVPCDVDSVLVEAVAMKSGVDAGG